MKRSIATLLLLLTVPAWSQSPFLLKDINQTVIPDAGSKPVPATHHLPSCRPESHRFATIGPVFFMRADNCFSGEELFSSLPTPNSARIVKDIEPGTKGSSPLFFTVAGNLLFFGARDGTHGFEPWVYDSTSQVAHLVKDIRTGTPDGGFEAPVAMGGCCYFFTQAASGKDLMKSDGTATGTVVLGNFAETWGNPIALGNRILFRGHSTVSGREVWVTDGTPAGTNQLQDTNPGTPSGDFIAPVVLGTRILFSARDASGNALWETDGTPVNTRKIGKPGNLDLPWQCPIRLGNRVVFRGSTATEGGEPWATDGTLQGTVLLRDFLPGRLTGGFSEPAVVGNRCFFCTTDSSGTGLAVTDGTTQGTRMVRNFAGNGPRYLEGLGTQVVFAADDAVAGEELWISDGTLTGTVLVKDIRPGKSASNPRYMTCHGPFILFQADNGIQGEELWITNGTPGGTRIHTNILGPSKVQTDRSNPDFLTNVFGVTYFQADSGGGRHLWKSDGTAGGTVEVCDKVEPNLSYPTAALGKYFFFLGYDAKCGWEPWVTDGTAAGTRMAVDSTSGTGNGYLYYPVIMGGACYWWSSSNSGYGFYRSDGVTTTLVADSASLKMSRGWRYPLVWGDKILFCGRFTNQGYEIGISDGTRSGTGILKDIYPGAGNGFCYNPTLYKNKVYFRANDGTGYGLWETDGTNSGTKLVKKGVDYGFYSIVGCGRLLFEGNNTMWVSDGTPAGTVQVPGITAFEHPVFCNGKVYFAGANSSYNCALYVTDGTVQGTKPVYNPQPGFLSNFPESIVRTGSRKLYLGMNMQAGNSQETEAFLYDTSTGKGKLLHDFNGDNSGLVADPCLAGNGLLLMGIDDGVLGSELYALDPGASVASCGNSHGAPLVGQDPRLGRSMGVDIPDRAPGTSAVLLLGRLTPAPLVIGNGGLYLDPAFGLFGPLIIPSAGLTLQVPQDGALIGSQVTLQGLVAPGSGFLGLDLTQALVLTMGD